MSSLMSYWATHNGGFALFSQVFLADSSRLADKIRLLP